MIARAKTRIVTAVLEVFIRLVMGREESGHRRRYVREDGHWARSDRGAS